MSTRSNVAFIDGRSTSGIYVHQDGTPASRLPVLAALHHRTFGRDLARMRDTLLSQTAGWLELLLDTDDTTTLAGDSGHQIVPGVGIAGLGVSDTADMIAAGDDVLDQEYAYVFDIDSRTVTVYQHGERILHLPEERWAPIGPTPVVRRSLRIVAPDPPGRLCLTGQGAVYTEGHISRLLRALDLDPDDGFWIDDGGGLFDFFRTAAGVGLLPDDAWFCIDGDDDSSEGGWIQLPRDLPGVEITTGAPWT